MFVGSGVADETVASNAEFSFQSDVAPILEQHCVRCHLPGNKKGDISLASIDDLLDNDHVIAGDPDNSYLLDLVAGVDGEAPEMPKGSAPLSDEEVAVVRRWIDAGAKWPKDVVLREKSKADESWWSLQPLRRQETTEKTHGIDDFVREKLREQGLELNPPADRRTLIRRATYDLIGLPPTPEEVERFVSDDDPKAYEKLVDRLLASPHYGERWGRHWLDVVRFGESNGFERNFIINELWPFRDYIIRSLNEDKPFDQLIREHIAGDVLESGDPNATIGTAFLVAGPYDDVGNQDAVQAAQIRANTLDEIIRATSEAFLGMTLGCARCHDHKFDPIKQEDYYAMYATFAGIKHGSAILATPEQRRQRADQLVPLNKRRASAEKAVDSFNAAVMARANERITEFEAKWIHPAIDRTGTEEIFEPTSAKFVRLICESVDSNPRSTSFKIDEFEIWSHGDETRNVALASLGAKASGEARVNEDFPGVYGAHLAIDGNVGERFISASNSLTIELAEETEIDRVLFSSARDAENPQQGVFGGFPADYRIEVSLDGKSWSEVANGRDRKPANENHRNYRLLAAEITKEELDERQQHQRLLDEARAEIAKVPALPRAWIGTRNEHEAKGPFHLFVGGSPQKKGSKVVPASWSMLRHVTPTYELTSDAVEAERRVALATWTTSSQNPLTSRVLANRIWHYHFGTGIVDTPSDFGYMGGRPTHPELLDYLAHRLIDGGWRIKSLHRLIMLSETYRQSSAFRKSAANVDSNSRLLWRFPPRRLSAEEVRDTILQVAGKLQRKGSDDYKEDVPDGGPGFRLYHYMQDNVSTYTPLDKHGPETYRRAIYHQNVRASVVDLMTEFDLPDCTFSSPKRAETTTPLQALTMLNHSFTTDMAVELADRVETEAGDDTEKQIRRAYALCYSRDAAHDEVHACREFVAKHGFSSLCRVLLNTSELIWLQ